MSEKSSPRRQGLSPSTNQYFPEWFLEKGRHPGRRSGRRRDDPIASAARGEFLVLQTLTGKGLPPIIHHSRGESTDPGGP